MEKFAVFRIGDEDFGIGINSAVEILNVQKIYAIPELPDFLSGVINVRGSVIPLLNLRKRFNIQTAMSEKKGRIIIVRFEGEKVGISVDSIDEIISLDSENISPPPSIFKGLKTEYLTGLGKKGDRIIILLDLNRILTSEEKIMLKESSEIIGSEARRSEGKNARAGKTA